MSLIFLAEQAIDLSGVDPNVLGGSMLAGLFAIIAAMFVIFFVVFIAMWIYMALAFSAMAKKAKQSSPGLAWIPMVGPAIIAFKASKMHWWPWLLLIGLVIPYLNMIAMLVFAVFAIIWQWKLFEAIDKPGWWAILCLISPVNLILWGIAAWSK